MKGVMYVNRVFTAFYLVWVLGSFLYAVYRLTWWAILMFAFLPFAVRWFYQAWFKDHLDKSKNTP